MKKYLVTLWCMLYWCAGYGQGAVHIVGGTKVQQAGPVYTSLVAGTFVNHGTYTDTGGTLLDLGGMSYSGGGTMLLHNFTMNHAGTTTTLGGLVSVKNTATLIAGNLAAGGGNLYIRTDMAPLASLGVTGVLTGTAQGLITKATATSGPCPLATTLTTNVGGPVVLYQWQSSPNNITFTSITGATNASYAASVTATAYYRAQLTTTNSSFSQATASVLVTTTGLPVVIPPAALTICFGATTTLSAAGADTYTWSPGTGLSATTGSVVAANPTVTTIYTITGTTACGSSAVTTTISVLSVPAPSPIMGGTTVCVGRTTSLSSAVGGGFWFSLDNSIASVNTSGVVSGVSAGSVPVVYTVTNICGTGYGFAAITVNTLTPTTGTAILCVSSTTTLSNATSGGTWSSSAMGVATVSSVGVVSGVAAGTAGISYSFAGGCVDVFTVTVQPPPSALAGSTSVCEGSSTTLSNIVLGGSWVSSTTGVATIGSTGIVSGVGVGTTTISYTLASGCGMVTTTVTVHATPGTIAGTASLCEGSSTTLSNSAVGGTWGSSATSVATIDAVGVLYGVSLGTASITYTALAGCGTTSTVVLVNAAPSAIVGTTSVCEGSSTILSNSVAGGSWVSDNTGVATIGSTGIVSGVGVGTTTISYTLASGCGMVTSTVTVHATPGAIAGTASLCEGSSTTLSNSAAGGTWGSSATSVATIDAVGVLYGVSSGTASITYTALAGCGTTSTVVLVKAAPSAIVGSTSVCEGSSITLSNSVAGGSWVSDNTGVATIGSTGIVSGVAVGTTTISYTLASGCGMVTTTITVHATPGAIAGTASLCEGSSTTLSNSAVGGTWGSSATSVATIDAAGIVSGLAAGTASITYTALASCGTTSTVVSVNAAPSAIAGSTSVCEGSSITLSNSVAGGSWVSDNTGVATIGSTGIVSGVGVGTTTISYTLASGCGMVTTTITVHATPGAIAGTASLCAGSTSTLSNSVVGGTWGSNSTHIAIVDSVTGIVSGMAGGVANITYSLLGCSATIALTVQPAPIVTGSSGYGSGVAGNIITVAGNGSMGASGDGGVATAAAIMFPSSVHMDASGNMYIGDQNTYRIRKVSPTGIISTIAGTGTYGLTGDGGPATAAQIGEAVGIISDRFGNIYFSESNSHKVRKIDASGVITTFAGTGTSGYAGDGGAATSAALSLPYGLATDISGNVYIINSGSFCVRKVSTSGIISTVAGTGTTGYSGDGGPATAAALSDAWCLAIDRIGNLYIADNSGNYVRKIDILGNISTVAGNGSGGDGGLATAAALSSVSGITTDEHGNVFLSESGTHTIRKVDGSGIIRTIAGVSTGGGSGSGSYSGDGGPATAATFGIPQGICADANGNIYVADYANQRIRKIIATNSDDVVLCAGATTTINTTMYGGVWTSTATGVATVGSASGVVTGVAAGTAMLSYVMPTGCGATKVVTVNPMPGTITGANNVCEGNSITLSNSLAGGLWFTSEPGIAAIDQSSGIVVGLNRGISVIYYDLMGCSVSYTFTVNPTPVLTGLSGFGSGVAGNIISVAGNGSMGASGDGGIATAAAIMLPSSVHVDAIGNMYIGDQNTYRIRKVSPTGIISTIAGTGAYGLSGDGGQATAAQIQDAVGITSDRFGNIYFSEVNTHKVRKIDASGVITTFAGTGAFGYTGDGGAATSAALYYPHGLAIDISGNVYIMNSGSHCVRKVSTSGIISTVAGTGTYGYSGDGGPATAAALSFALRIAIDRIGNLYIADNSGNYVRKVDVLGTISTFAGNGSGGDGGPATAAALSSVDGITTDEHGNVFLAESGTHTIRKVDAAGVISTIAGVPSGGGTGSYSGDGGPATAATFGIPQGICADVNGNIYVADYYNQRIRKIIATNSDAVLICAGATTTINTTVSGGAWTSSAAGVATVGSANGVVTGLAAGTAVLSYIMPTGCGATKVVTVNQMPGAITGTNNVCEGNSITLSNSLGGGLWFASEPGIAAIDQISGIVVGRNRGISVMHYERMGCSVSYTFTVNPTPVLTGSSGFGTGVAGNIITVAGDGSIGASGDGGIATAAAIMFPSSVHVDAIGNMYIGDQNSYRIRKVSPTGIISTIAGTGTYGLTGDGGPATAAQIQEAVGIVSDRFGNVYFSEVHSHKVRKIDAAGVITTFAGTGTSGYAGDGGAATSAALASPYGLAIDILGNVYIANIGSFCVRKVSTSGIISTVAGTGTYGYSGDGGPATAAGLRDASCLAIDRIGNLYIADNSGNYVRKVDILGTISTFAGNGSGSGEGIPATAVSLYGVSGITTDEDGNVFLAERGTHTIRKVDGSGIISWISGVGYGNYSGDGGPASAAILNYPQGICADANGNIYIADFNNNRIRKILSAKGDAVEICVGATATINTTVSGGAWTSTATGVATVGSASGVVTGVSGGTATISYNLPTGCGATKVVTVNTTPGSGSLTGGSGVCAGATITLSNAVTGGIWSSSDTFATVSGGIVSGISAGTVVISYSVSNRCGAGVATQSVSVINVPTAGTLSGATAVCEGGTSTLTSTVSGGVWSSGSTATATVLAGVVHGIAAGTATISYIVSNTCGADTTATTLTINPLPVAGTLFGASSVSIGATISLSASVGGGTWSSSNSNATVSGGVVTGIASGSVVISYAVTNGCGTTFATTTVAVLALTPGAILGGTSVCAGATLTLSNALAGGVWTSTNTGNAIIGSASGIVTGVSPGGTTISYTESGISVTLSLTISPVPAAISGVQVVCVGSITTISTASTGGSWISQYPSVATASATAYGIVGGVSGGTSTISYVFASGCYTTRSFTVSSLPATISGPGTLCLANTVTYSNSVSGGLWSCGNPQIAAFGTTSGIATASGSLTGNPVITYTMPGNCFVTKPVAVLNLTTAISGTASVCAGQTTNFTHASTGAVWSSSDVAIATTATGSGTVYGVAEGTATISYYVSSGCMQTKVVTVNPAPGAIAGATAVCAGSTISLTNPVSGGAWVSGTTATATVGSGTGVVSGVAAGSSTISYSIGSCRAFYPVTVQALPAVISGTATVCAGSVSTLTSSPMGGVWTSSVPSVASIGSGNGVVSALVAGTAIITYFTSSGCMQTKVVTVNPAPGAIAGATALCVGQTISLSNPVSGGTWVSSATAKALVGSGTGVVSGVAAGSSTISYTIGSCRATYNVTVGVIPNTITGATSVCAGNVTTLGTSPAGGTWSSSNTSVATASAAAVISGVSGGTSTITYSIGSGCYRVTTVNVSNTPSVITGAGKICLAQVITLSNAIAGGTWSLTGTGASINASTGVLTAFGGTTGTPLVSYTMPGNCRATVTVSVVNLTGIGGGPGGPLCAGRTTTFTNAVAGGVWSAVTPSVALMATGSGAVTGLSAGSSVISYTVSPGCAVGTFVNVNASPGILSGYAAVCVGSSVSFSNTVSGGLWSSTNATVASVNSASGIVTGVSASTIPAIIAYTMPGGCSDTMGIRVVTLGAINGASTVCEGQTTTFTNAAAGGTWTTTNAGVASIHATSGVIYGAGVGTAVISYTIGSGCTVSKSITVNSSAQITGLTSVCQGETITLSIALSGGTWSSTYTSLATIGSASGIVTGVSGSGTVNMITYNIPGGCSDTALLTINYRAPITGANVVCEGTTVHLSNLHAGAGGTWSSSSTANATITPSTADVWGVAAGATTISYLLPTGCVSTYAMTINPAPAAITGPGVVCVGSAITLSNTTTGGVWSIYYTSTGTIGSASGIVTGISGGSVANIITYTLPTGCRDTALVMIDACARPSGSVLGDGSGSIRVLPNPNAGTFTISGRLAETNDELLLVEVTNMLGQVVYRGNTLAVEGTINAQVQLGKNIANGMYLLTVKSNKEMRVFHIVVEQ